MIGRYFSRLPLLWKILLLTSVAITVLLGITGWFVQQYALRTTAQGLQDEVQASLRAYEALWHSRADMLAKVSLVVSNMSDVRAAFRTGDQATIRDTAGELWSKISQEDAIFLVTDGAGTVIASLGGETRLTAVPIVRNAVARFPKQAVGFMSQDGKLYQVVVTPVYVAAQTGAALLNVLVAGYAVSDSVARTLKQSTGSDFVFSAGGNIVASTFDPSTAAGLQRARMESSDHAVLATPLADIDGKVLGELRIYRSFAQARQHLASLRQDLVVIWLGSVAVGLVLSYFLSRRIVGPIKRLETAAAEVARQNYDLSVPVEREDELGRLASSFNTMCTSIREAREELIRQERLATIGHISTSIVHDLRNPLAAIYGGSEMLVDGDLPPSQVKRLANNIYRSSRRIQELLQDLVNVSRRSAEPAELCCLLDVVTAACDPLTATAQAQNVKIVFDVPPGIELPLERAHMERVFLNLCTNALEAMLDGGTLRISAEQNGTHVMVRVQDTGTGVPEQIRSRLFQPFATSGKKNGLGLGLALSRQTVLAHRGDLWSEPAPHGACFCLRLPL